jgi:hypothetical protein
VILGQWVAADRHIPVKPARLGAGKGNECWAILQQAFSDIAALMPFTKNQASIMPDQGTSHLTLVACSTL